MALVVLLRGVNVGGHRTFRPKILAEQLADLDVVNIGAAGTFIVRGAKSQARVRDEFARRLPFETDIMICRGADIVRLMAKNPFARQPVRRDVTQFVTVLARRPRDDAKFPQHFPSSGKWLVKVLARDDRYVMGVYRRDMQTIRYLGALDRQIGERSTTRNWNTMKAIADVLSQFARRSNRTTAEAQ
jgi:uncharacterized protein (DUF1697 family)